MTNLIGISGKAQHGKDTVGKIIQSLVSNDYGVYKNQIDFINGGDWVREKQSGWKIKKFADALKQIASILTGIPVDDFEKIEVKDSYLNEEWDWSNPQGPRYKIREFLQRLGTDAIRANLHPNTWVNALFSTWKPVKMSQYNPSQWIVTDVRFPNEADAIKKRNGIMIRVNRDICPKCRNSENLHYNYISGEKYESILCNECGTIFNEKKSQHLSETALDDYNFDYIIENSGTIEDLIEKVKKILIKEEIIK